MVTVYVCVLTCLVFIQTIVSAFTFSRVRSGVADTFNIFFVNNQSRDSRLVFIPSSADCKGWIWLSDLMTSVSHCYSHCVDHCS